MPHRLLIVEPIGERDTRGVEGGKVASPNPTLHGSACDIDVRQRFEAEDFASNNT